MRLSEGMSGDITELTKEAYEELSAQMAGQMTVQRGSTEGELQENHPERTIEIPAESEEVKAYV